MIIPAVTPAAQDMLLGYLCAKINTTLHQLIGGMPFEVMGIARNGRHMGAVLFTNYRETSIELAWAGEPGWATRSDLRDIFSYPFNQLGVLRVSGCVARGNSASRNFASRLGAREVGVLEGEYGPGKDGIMYAMTRDKCKWIAPIKNNGTK